MILIEIPPFPITGLAPVRWGSVCPMSGPGATVERDTRRTGYTEVLAT
jgi:hypothetical protein